MFGRLRLTRQSGDCDAVSAAAASGRARKQPWFPSKSGELRLPNNSTHSLVNLVRDRCVTIPRSRDRSHDHASPAHDEH